MLDFMQTYIDIYYVYECTNTLHIYIYIYGLFHLNIMQPMQVYNI